MLEVSFKASKDKLARLSAYLGERLATLTLLKVNSIIIEAPASEAVRAVNLIRSFLAEGGQPDFLLATNRNKITVEALTPEADAWARRQDSPVGLPAGIYQCYHCGKIFTNDEELRTHTIIHYV